MRIYNKLYDAFREVERDLWEMGINVHPQTMQDKNVADDPDYLTKEVQFYGFKLHPAVFSRAEEERAVRYLFQPRKKEGEGVKVAGGEAGLQSWGKSATLMREVLDYIEMESWDRITQASNPGNAYKMRERVWGEFLHEGKFAYTYSERICPQLHRIIRELKERPDTRQAIINIHSNISPMETINAMTGTRLVGGSADMRNMGGTGRIPCSLYYQFLIRQGQLNMVYAMRSCDFLTHFPVDICLAIRLMNWVAHELALPPGTFTYFTASLHAYAKDMKDRGIF